MALNDTITALGNAIINLVDKKTPIATANTVGMVKPDGSTINIDANGVISSNGGGGSGLEVCDIGMALYVDETKGLRRYLNGQIVDRNTNTEAFFTRLQEITTLHPSLLCTENEWQTAKTMSVFGQVGKFVFNYSDDGVTVVSVRIPRVVNVQGVFDLQNLGMTVAESLPNIKGEFTAGATYEAKNSFYEISRISGLSHGNTASRIKAGFDASRSSSTYQDGAPVQQEAIQYPYFIQIATGSETENNIINEIELNNPYSLFDSKYSDHELNNLSWLKSEGQWNAKAVYTDAYDKLIKVYNGTETVEGLSVKLSTETYTDYDFVLNTANETFRLPLKTKLASGKAVVGNGIALGLTNNSVNFGINPINSAGQGALAAYTSLYGTNVGTVSTTTASYGNGSIGVTTNATKSGIELSDSGLYLYFYVGETVQNANLIDAGRIGEQLAGKQDKCIHIIDTYVNGTSGYRIWSDGYCEQWGEVIPLGAVRTITFLKPFKDTNYSLSQSFRRDSNPSGSTFSLLFYEKTSSSVKAAGQFNNSNNVGFPGGTDEVFSWKASGYLAEGEY